MDRIATNDNLAVLTSQTTMNNFAMRNDNMLLNEALILLDYACLFRQAKISANDDVIKAKVITEIIKYQNKIQNHIYSSDVPIAASYCICAAIDEAVLAGLETIENSWASETLLCSFHNDTWGGERVFEIYDQARLESQPDLVELIFMLLSLGFTGKFFESSLSLSEMRKDSIFINSINYSSSNNLNSLIHPLSVFQFDIAEYFSLSMILAIFLVMMCSVLNVGLWYFHIDQSNMIKNINEQNKVTTNL